MEGTSEQRGWRGWGGKAALAVGGMLVGGVLVGTLTANAANTTGTAGQAGAYGARNPNGAYGAPGGPRHGGNVDESKSQRPDEHLLTGDTASKVRAAALARYPDATVLRVETDSDGVYEAHLIAKSGQRVTVEVDKAFKVTGEESGPGHPSPRRTPQADVAGAQPLVATIGVRSSTDGRDGMAIFRILEGRARPGRVDDIARMFETQAEAVGQAKGIAFVQVLKSGDQILGISCWRSGEDMQRYLELEATREFYGQLPPLLMGTPSIRTYEVVRSLAGGGASDVLDWMNA